MYNPPSFLDTLAKAIKIGSMPEQMESQIGLREAQKQRTLSDIISRQKKEADPLAKIGSYPELFRAQTLHRHYADTLGEEHPITQEAKKNYDLLQRNTQIMGDWRGAMAKTAPTRFLSPTAKAFAEAKQAYEGTYPSAASSVPGSPILDMVGTPGPSDRVPTLGEALEGAPRVPTQAQQPEPAAIQAGAPIQQQGISPAAIQESREDSPLLTAREMAGTLVGEGIKASTTSSLVDRNTGGTNAEITIQNLEKDQPAMEYFSGAEGRAELANEKRKSAQGKASPKYTAYERYLTNADLLSSQVRRFYGDSVQEGAMAKLEELANPSSWIRDPNVAKEKFNTFKTTFRQERRALQKAVTDAKSTYREDAPSAARPRTLGEAIDSQGKSIEMDGKKYVRRNGRWTLL